MYRSIIYDNLNDKHLKTKKCLTEKEAKIEGINSIMRLCRKFKVSIADNRFEIECIEIG